jgi:type I restriction enzyme S subunit
LLEDTADRITPAGLSGSGAALLPASSLLVTTRATLGARAVNTVPVTTNQGFRSVVLRRPQEASYYYHLLERVKCELVRRASGTTFLEISGTEFASVEIPDPPSPEKMMIAHVLDTIDHQIEAGTLLIEKLTAMRQGLLHDLLTRGLDENGELRALPAEEPGLYDASSAGPVPRTWRVGALAHACVLLRDGTHLPPPRVEDGPLLLSVRNMRDGNLVLTEQDTRVSKAFYDQMHRHWRIEPGDVLLAIVGATIGKVARVGSMPQFTLQRSVAVLRGDEHQLLNDFLNRYLPSPRFQADLWKEVNQTAQPGIYLDQLGSIRIPLPPVDEQREICTRMNALEEKIRQEVNSLGKLKLLKAALADDLLTGRVRVTPLLANAQSALEGAV